MQGFEILRSESEVGRRKGFIFWVPDKRIRTVIFGVLLLLGKSSK